MLSTRAAFVSLLLAAGARLAPAAETVIAARYIVTMDPARRVIDRGAIRVRDALIVEVAERAQFRRVDVDLGEAILMPGLINAHTHAPMSLFRGLADDLPLQDWLERFIFPAEARHLNAEFVRWGTRLACLEMLLGGTTTFVDMYYFEDVVAEETRRAGLRAILGETIIRFPVADHRTPEEALRWTEGFLARYARDPLITPGVAPHALYTNRDETLQQARALARQFRAPLLIHLSETAKENRENQAVRGVSPTRTLDALGVLEGWTIAAHGVWLDGEDIRVLRDRGAGVAHCPSSNMKLASGIAPVLRLLQAGVPVGLGTDGPAGSNNDFNLFEEMDLASKLAKVASGDPTALPARQAVAMATIEGARAIGLSDQIGSLETGKRADLIALRLDQPHARPLFDLYSQIVSALKASDVTDVMVEGRWILRRRRPLTLDPATIRSKALQYQEVIRRSLPPPPATARHSGRGALLN